MVKGKQDSSTGRVFGMKAENGRWLFVIFGFIINICLGSVYAYSVFKNPIQKLFNVGAFEGGHAFHGLPGIFCLTDVLWWALVGEAWS